MADKQIVFGFLARDQGVERTFDRIGDAAQTAGKKGEKSSRGFDRVGDAAQTAGKKVEKSSKGFATFSKNIGGGLKAGVSTGVAALPAIALAGGLLVGMALVKGIKKTLDYQDSQAKLRAQMGLTVEESKKIGATAGKLYSQAYGQNMAQVNEAIKSVIQNGAVLRGTASKDLQEISGKVLNLANTFDQDLGGVTRAVGQMMRTGLAKDGKQALDILTRGFQTGANKADDLLDTMNEYGTQFRKVGIDGPTAMGLISQAVKAGARDSDIAADAIKEFSIRAIDGSKGTAAGFKDLGLSASKMAAQIGKGGKSASDALDLTLDRLRKIPDPVKRSQIAVGLFGTQAEDLGDALFAMDPSTAVAALGKVGGAADDMGKTLTTPQARLVALKRSLEMKVQGWLMQAFDWFNKHRFDIADGLLTVADGAVKLIQPLSYVAAAGLRVGQALLYVAGAALIAKGKVSAGKELFHLAGDLGTAADKAIDLGKSLTDKATPAIVNARKKVDELRARSKTTLIIETQQKVAEANIARIKKQLADPNLTKTRRAQLEAELGRWNAQYAAVMRQKAAIGRPVSTTISVTRETIYKTIDLGNGQKHRGVGMNAAGTPSWRGGLTWVGEKGPELVSLPRGTAIYDAQKSSRMAGADGSGRGSPAAPIVINISGALDPDAVARQIEQLLLRRKRKVGS